MEIKKEDKIEEEDEVPKNLIKREDKTLFWVFLVIGMVFASILIPYFIHQASKKFTYNKINWNVENPGNLVIFHGRFLSLTNPNLHYNIFLEKIQERTILMFLESSIVSNTEELSHLVQKWTNAEEICQELC